MTKLLKRLLQIENNICNNLTLTQSKIDKLVDEYKTISKVIENVTEFDNFLESINNENNVHILGHRAFFKK